MVIQQYEAEADNEYVIRGNSAIMKCEIPSYVSDFIVVDMWADSDGGSYYPNEENYGTSARPFKSDKKVLVRIASIVSFIILYSWTDSIWKHTKTKNSSLP